MNEAFKKYWMWILGGGVVVGLLWHFMSGSSAPSTSALPGQTLVPGGASNTIAPTGPTAGNVALANINAQAALQSQQLTMQYNLGMGQLQNQHAQISLQPLLTEYSAGTQVAITALNNAGAAERAAMGGAALSTAAYANSLGQMSAATSSSIANVSKSNAAQGASTTATYGQIGLTALSMLAL